MHKINIFIAGFNVSHAFYSCFIITFIKIITLLAATYFCNHLHITVQKLPCQTPIKHTTNISEPLRISVKYSFIFPDDGSHTIRNMSE